jgi:hypothetical protein
VFTEIRFLEAGLPADPLNILRASNSYANICPHWQSTPPKRSRDFKSHAYWTAKWRGPEDTVFAHKTVDAEWIDIPSSTWVR